MTFRRVLGVLNALLLFGIILSDTLFLSEIGLEGSIWNALSVVLCLVFILINISRLRFSRVARYGLPVACIALSTVVNASALPMSSFRSAAATGTVFAVLWLSPVVLNHRLLRRLVFLYLIVGAGVSLNILAQSPDALIENVNFNVNPNGAANYFYLCSALSLLLIESRIKWVLVGIYGVLLITTSARTGNAAFVVSLVAYYVLHNPRHRRRLKQKIRSIRARMGVKRLVLRTLQLLPIAALAWYLAVTFVPDSFSALTLRLNAAVGPDGIVNNRAGIWNDAIQLSLVSPATILVGHGPATISTLINAGSSGSYIEAIGSYGYPFTVASLAVALLWMRSLVRRGHRQILVVGPALLLYGVTDTSIFSGISMLWFLFVFSGIYLESNDSSVRSRRKVRQKVSVPIELPGSGVAHDPAVSGPARTLQDAHGV